MQSDAADRGEAAGSSGLDFTHLHLHTSYSLLDGAIRIPQLMKRVRELGMSAVAMTDHGNMFGAVEFYKAAVKEGVKPIIGCEFYVAPGSRKDKKVVERLADGNNYHLVLLAQNTRGYENIIRLASRSYTEGFYRKPRIDYELLSEHSEGVICLTACLGGEVQSRIIHGQPEVAWDVAGKLSEIFGKDRFYLEIQNHGLPEEAQAAKENVQIARRLGINLVLTNDSHFLTREDHAAQDILLRINQKKTIDDDLQFAFNPEFYVKSPDEMARLFPELMDAFHNTTRINEMVDLNFEFGNPLLPQFDVPAGYTLDSWMRKLCIEGLEKRYGNPLPAKVRERFEFEFGVIQSMDFPGYFLIVQDFINHAKSRGIPVGPGRGSAAGSIVAYSLGITDLDPLKYDLLFERFLNPDRKEMPDIDVDFCAERREEVIAYCRDKYGSDKVGQIITYGTMAAKACLKDVARVLNIPFEEANSISKMFPDQLGIGIDDAVQHSSELRAYSEKGEVQKKLFQVARTLEGNVRHTGVHAAGVVIAPRPLEELVPMASVANKAAGETGRVLVSQFDMSALTDVGLVKMDFLGLRNLTIISHCLEGIKRRGATPPDLDRLPEGDEKTYELLQRGDVLGVFQLESSPGMREFVMRLKPQRFEDIIALIALFRPGPLMSGMAESFINRKKGREKVTYPHADLERVLGDTYGVIVYQEQVMLISRVIGGFTPAEADLLRKAMGKKIAEKMAEMRVKFIEGGVKNGYGEQFSADLYDQMAQFAAYGFNKSHSAAYALIVYQTAFLKANFPTDYMRAVLDSEMDKTEKLVPYINACKQMDIQLLGPDVNESRGQFTYIDEGVIRFGLAAIKGVGQGAVDSIVEAREALKAEKGIEYSSTEKPAFESFFEFMEHVDLRHCNRRTVESLALSGAFDSLGYTRKTLMQSLDVAFTHAQRAQADREAGQNSLFGADMFGGGGGGESSDAEPIPRGPDASEYPQQERLSLEKEVLGFYFSGHPLKKYENTLRRIRAVPIALLGEMASGSKVEIAGVINDYSIRLTKTNREMCRLLIEDMSGGLEAVIFPRAYEQIKGDVIKDTPLFIEATVEKREETGTPQLIVNRLKPLDGEVLEEKAERSLHLKLRPDALDQKSLSQLQTILRSSRGSIAVFFHLDAQGREDPMVIRAHESFNVSYTQELRDRLAGLEQVLEIYYSAGGQMKRLYARRQPETAAV